MNLTDRHQALAETSTARWLDRLNTYRRGQTRRTRERFLRAVITLANGPDPAELTRERVLERAHASSEGGLYEHFHHDPDKSPGALLAHVPPGLWPPEPHLPPHLRSLRTLLAEARTWAFWPYRESWRSALSRYPLDLSASAEAYVRVLAQWAIDQPRLARTGAPLCALEDLLVILPGEPIADEAGTLVARCVELAVDPAGRTPLGVLNQLRPALKHLLLRNHTTPAVHLAELTMLMADCVEDLLASPGAIDREETAAVLLPSVRKLVRLLEAEGSDDRR